LKNDTDLAAHEAAMGIRFKLEGAIDLRSEEEKALKPFEIGIDEFKGRIVSIKKGIKKWGTCVVQGHVVVCVNKNNPGLVDDHGKKIQDFDQLCQWLRSGALTDLKLKVAGDAMFGALEINNRWAKNYALEFCKMMGIEFTGEKTSKTVAVKRKTDTNCITHYLVVQKNTAVARLNNILGKIHNVRIFVRGEKGAKDKGSRRVKATFQDHGFNGYIEYLPGHPKAEGTTITNDVKMTESPSVIGAVTVDTPSTMTDESMEKMFAFTATLTNKTQEEVKKAWIEEQLNPEGQASRSPGSRPNNLVSLNLIPA